MKLLGMAVSVVLAAGCSDVVTERYATAEDARRAGLFERGWLPDVIPSSAHSIEARNDLDLNVSAGEFFLSRSDFERLVARIEPYSAGPANADVRLADYLAAKQKEGLRVGVVRESLSSWAFVCDPQTSRCTYQLASRR